MTSTTRVVPISRAVSRAALTGAAAAILLAGCASTDSEPASEDAATPDAVGASTGSAEADQQPTLSVTFDGATCSYDGPAELTAGVVNLEAVNDSDISMLLAVTVLIDGATFDDFVEYHQPEPKVTPPPDFADIKAEVRADPGTTDGFTYPLSGGEHALACVTFPSDGEEPSVWVAQPGGVTVSG